MAYRKLFGVLAGSVAIIWLAVPAETEACGLFGCFGGCGQTASRVAYAPILSPAACPTQTCNYVPQISYRTVYRSVPVTTYRAFSTCDPCTGCPVTTYRPVTTWACQRALVPYTTYRLVCSNPCDPCGSFGGYAGVSYGVPASACASCAAGAIGTPLEPYPEPANSQPTINGAPQPKTFQENDTPAGSQESPLKAVPSPTGTRVGPSPPIISPPPQDRTAWRAASY